MVDPHLAAEIDDAERLAAAALAGSRGFWSASRRVDTERVSTLELALATLGDRDQRLRCRLLADLAGELVHTDAEAVRRLSDEALDIARRLGDTATLACVLAPRYNTISGDPGTLDERLENTAELLDAAE